MESARNPIFDGYIGNHAVPMFETPPREWLQSFVVGEPIRSWLQPRITADEAGLVIKFTSIDTETGTRPFTSTFAWMYPIRVFGERFRDEQHFHQLVREALHVLVMHEVDEAIRCHGAPVFNPHLSKYRAPQVVYP